VQLRASFPNCPHFAGFASSKNTKRKAQAVAPFFWTPQVFYITICNFFKIQIIMSNNGKIILGVAVAAAAGAVVGMLFAPDKGSGLRRKIGQSVNDWTDEVVRAINSSKGRITEAVDKAASKAQEMASQHTGQQGSQPSNRSKSPANAQ
jgi:gas vesicle protein